MSIVNQPCLSDILIYFEKYVSGELSDLTRHMAAYTMSPHLLHAHFYLTNIQDEAVLPHAMNLMSTLCIPKAQQQIYIQESKTLYEFFVVLYKNGNMQVGHFLDLINKRARIRRRWNIAAVIFLLIYFLSILKLPSLHNVLLLTKGFIYSSLGLPLLGVGLTFIFYGFSVYQLFFGKKATLFCRSRNFFFATLNTAINLAAYALWIFRAAGSMTPLIGGLFILASVVDVVKEVVCLMQEYIQYRYYPPECGDSCIKRQWAIARHKHRYKKSRNAIIISCIAAVFLVLIIGAWSFCGGIPAMIAGILSISIVYLIKTFCLHVNRRYIHARLQKKLSDLNEKAAERLYCEAPDSLVTRLGKNHQEVEQFAGIQQSLSDETVADSARSVSPAPDEFVLDIK